MPAREQPPGPQYPHAETGPPPADAPVALSIVIVSWNVAALLADCLDSLSRQTDAPPWEAVVVDNASPDDTVAMLQQRYPWVRLIANRQNRGFAGANNQGIAAARGRFVLLLNPDTIVSAGALHKLVDFLSTHPQVAIVGPNLRQPNGQPDRGSARRSYSLAAALWLDALRLGVTPLLGRILRRRLAAPYDYNVTQPVEAVSGAAMLARRELLQDLGGFAEVFLHCGEDIDLCFRVRAQGLEIWYLAEAVIVHLGGRSTKKAVVRTAVNAALSNAQFFRRCHGRGQALAFRLIVQCVQMPCLLGIGLVKLLARREHTADLVRRCQIARALIAWRPVR